MRKLLKEKKNIMVSDYHASLQKEADFIANEMCNEICKNSTDTIELHLISGNVEVYNEGKCIFKKTYSPNLDQLIAGAIDNSLKKKGYNEKVFSLAFTDHLLKRTYCRV